MKIVLYIGYLWLICSSCYAGDTTQINFSTGTWQEILIKSKQERKPIFIDFYTTWCGPCVTMSKEAFNDDQVSKLFNKQFINYKVNAEEGEGIALAKQFNILAYPTLLFVDTNQQVIYRTEGYQGIHWLIEEAQKVVDTKGKLDKVSNITSVKRGLEASTYTKEYLMSLAKLRQPSDSLLNAYLEQLSPDQLISEENLAIMAGTVFSTKSIAFETLLQQLPYIKNSSIGQEALITLPRAVASDFKKIIENNDEEGLELLINKSKRLFQQSGLIAPKLVEQEELNQRIDFYRITKRFKEYHQLANFYAHTQLMSQSTDSLREQDRLIYQEFQRRVVANDSVRKTISFLELDDLMKHRASKGIADKLNHLAWAYYESVPISQYLQVALEWISRSLELHYDVSYQNTLAHLLYKTGQRRKAIKYQEIAIANAKRTDKKIAEMITSLNKMKNRSL